MATNDATPKHDLVAELDRLDSALERANERIAEFGEADLQELADIYEQFTDVIDRYEEDVTDDGGDIQDNIEFQSAIAAVVDDIPDDLLLKETFDECDERLQKRWFHDSDFEYVRDQLEPVADLVGRLERRDELLDSYRETRRDIRYRARDLDDRIAELDRLSRLSTADLDAPTEHLRDPIETYNDAVAEAFETFRLEAPARDIVDFLEKMTVYPLIPFETPDEELVAYLQEYPPGEETVPKLLEYADYSHSKLSHYVDEPDRLTRVVGRKQTYLDGLDADPLCISWPPPTAETLRWRCQELTAAVNRFGPDVVEHLRTVAALPQETSYETLRDTAVVREDLTDEERERIEHEDIGAELTDARAERDQLRNALETFPDR
jgi:hypothetical protein